jgi:NADH-quinone oxidoreductase subunit H
MLLMSTLTALLFMGGWSGIFNGVLWLAIKASFVLFGLIWVRAAFPRYRYDQLMRLGWKVFLPLSLAWVMFVSGLLLLLNVAF